MLVIVPDAQLRRSVAFLLEAEGYAVHAFASLADADRRAPVACAIVDEAAVTGGAPFWTGLAALALSSVILSSKGQPQPQQRGMRLVEKPLLGQRLVDAVQAACRVAREGTT